MNRKHKKLLFKHIIESGLKNITLMKKTFISIIFLLNVTYIFAQNFDDLSFGTDNTFDVITWNIEQFPKNDQTTIDYVTQMIENLDAEVLAIQELNDTALFKQMVNDMPDYKGYSYTNYYSGYDLAYIYKAEQVEISDIYEIYTTSAYWNKFPRAPMVMELSYGENNFVLINNHLKCCGDGILDLSDSEDEETRRYRANEDLKDYIDSNFSEENVILIGDLNDLLTDDLENNVFQMFLEDSSNYKFADMEIAEGDKSNWSYPDWPSHLDHILITDELFEVFGKEESEVKTIKPGDYFPDGFSGYESDVSDHRPVGIKLSFEEQTGLSDSEPQYSYFENYPNPFEQETTFQFKKIPHETTVEIYDILGQKVHSVNIARGKTSLHWNAEGLQAGIYFARLVSEGRNIGFTKLVKSR